MVTETALIKLQFVKKDVREEVDEVGKQDKDVEEVEEVKESKEAAADGETELNLSKTTEDVESKVDAKDVVGWLFIISSHLGLL